MTDTRSNHIQLQSTPLSHPLGNKLKHIAIAAALIAVAPLSNAGIIVGGSSLLNAPYLAQLESWLGEGALTLTNIFTKNATSTSVDFHAAVDGKGRTFAVMSASNNSTSAVIGGYNPNAWNASINNYVYTGNDVDKTAFIFNLSNGWKFIQNFSGQGAYQAFNHSTYGHHLWWRP
jgi:hypothetical protein